MGDSTGPELLVAAFNTLSVDDQEEAFARLREQRLQRQAAEATMTGRCLRSLLVVRDHLARVPTVEDYRLAYRELTDAGEDLISPGRVIRHFGSWALAKQALGLSDSTDASGVEARLRNRRLGKVHRYDEGVLRDVLLAAADYYSEAEGLDFRRAISSAEFSWWRERELERRRAGGDDAAHHLPSYKVFWNRYGRDGGGWAGVLRHYGFAEDEIGLRLAATSGRYGSATGPKRANDYSEDDLRQALHRAADAYSEAEGLDGRRAISMSEYEDWRGGQLEAARAAGEILHLPGYNVFRKRHARAGAGWPAVLSHFGWAEQDIPREMVELAGRIRDGRSRGRDTAA